MDRRKAQAGVIEVDLTTSLAAQMATMTLLLKTTALNNGGMIGPAVEMNVMNQVVAVSCVQCGEAHLYHMCPHNSQSVCYVQNSPYNPSWRNHLNFS